MTHSEVKPGQLVVVGRCPTIYNGNVVDHWTGTIGTVIEKSDYQALLETKGPAAIRMWMYPNRLILLRGEK